MKKICVIDGMGGGIGSEIISHLNKKLAKQKTPGSPGIPGTELVILALGTNAGATERMIAAGASRGASGENAIKINTAGADFIIGPIGIAFPNALMGEITPTIAESISLSPAIKILIPVTQTHYIIPGLEDKPLAEFIEQGIEKILDVL